MTTKAPMFENRYLAHALGGLDGHKYLNTEEALKNAIALGHRYFEADLQLTSDGQVVCSHGWTEDICAVSGMDYSEEFETMTHDLFLAQKVFGMPTMDLDTLAVYIKKYKDLYWELDIHGVMGDEARLMIQVIKDTVLNEPGVEDRVLMQVASPEQYEAVDSVYHFKYYQYFIRRGTEPEVLSDIITFCKENGIIAVALQFRDCTKEKVAMMKEAGLAVLAYSNDGRAIADALFENGVDTLCTNFLSPAEDIIDSRGTEVLYNGGKSNASKLEDLVAKKVLRGEIGYTKNSSVKYTERFKLTGLDHFDLMACLYEREGYEFAGWNLRYKGLVNEWLWLCDDGEWRTPEAINECETERRLFADMESVDIDLLLKKDFVIFQAVWNKIVPKDEQNNTK